MDSTFCLGLMIYYSDSQRTKRSTFDLCYEGWILQGHSGQGTEKEPRTQWVWEDTGCLSLLREHQHPGTCVYTGSLWMLSCLFVILAVLNRCFCIIGNCWLTQPPVCLLRFAFKHYKASTCLVMFSTASLYWVHPENPRHQVEGKSHLYTFPMNPRIWISFHKL